MNGWVVQTEQWDAGQLTVRGRTAWPEEWQAVEKAGNVVKNLRAQGYRDVSPGVLRKGDSEQRVTVESGRKFDK